MNPPTVFIEKKEQKKGDKKRQNLGNLDCTLLLIQ